MNAPALVSTPQHDTAAAIAFLKRLDADGWHNLVAIDPETGRTEGATFEPGQWAPMAEWIEARQGRANLYYMPNEPVAGAADRKLGKRHVARVRALYVDVDPDPIAAGRDGLAAERRRILERLREFFAEAGARGAAPTALVDTGNGYQLIWRLDEPLAAADAATWAEAQSLALAARLGGDNVHNVDRVLRLPGTVNLPNASKRARGRQAAPAVLMAWEKPSRRADLETFCPPAARAPAAPDRDGDIAAVQARLEASDYREAATFAGLPAGLQSRFEALLAGDRTLARLWDGAPSAIGGKDESGSGFRFALAGILKGAGWEPEDFARLCWIWEHATANDREEKLDPRRLARDWTRRDAVRVDAAQEFGPVALDAPTALSGEIDPPADLWAESDFPRDLPLGVLPPALERFARDEARRKNVDLGAVGVPLLVTFAAALPARFQVQVKQHDTGHTDRAILWGALVGPPGARKTPVLRAVMRALEEIEAGWARTYAAARATHDAALRAAKAAKGAPMHEPPRPRRRRKIVSDVTIEGLAAVLADNPDGLLCFVDELAQWAGNMDAYRAGKAVSRDQSFWLQAKGGGRYQVDRISREVPDVEVNAVNVLGGIQPDVLKRLAPEWGGNGVLQRFLLHVMGRSGPAPDMAPDEAAAAAIRHAVGALVGLTPSEFASPFRFTREADEHRRDVVSFAAAMMARPDVPTPLQGWLDKMEGEWARIALTFHAAEWAAGMGPILEEPIPLEIGADAARRAKAFLIDYQFAHQAFFYRSMGLAGEANEDAKAVAAHILAHGLAEIDDRGLQRKLKSRFGGRDRRAARLATMRALEDLGWVRPTGAADRTDGKERAWLVRPEVHAEFADRAAAFRARLAEQRHSIQAAGAERRSPREIEGPGG